LQLSSLLVVERRRLVVRLAAGEGETLVSYLDRLAADHKAALGSMLARTGLISEDNQKNMPGYGVTLTSDEIVVFSFVTGLTEQQVENLLLRRYAPRIFSLPENLSDAGAVRKASVSEWAYFGGSHFCPECLKDSNGIWLAKWRLPWSFACVKHRVLLGDTCPDCGRRPRAGMRDGRLFPPFHAQVPTPMHCNNPLTQGDVGRGKSARPCGCDLTKVQAVPASDNALATQQRLDLLLDADAAKSGDEHSLVIDFKELRSLCVLLMYGAEVEDFHAIEGAEYNAILKHIQSREAVRTARKDVPQGRHGPKQRLFIGVPTDAALMSALLQRALPIAESEHIESMQDSVQQIVDRVRGRHGMSDYAVANDFQMPERLKLLYEHCVALRGNVDRRFGVRSSMARGENLTFEEKNIPQLFFEEGFKLRFERFFEFTNRADLSRQFCSMVAVKLIGYTWSEAGAALELRESADRQANHYMTQLARRGIQAEFFQEMRSWAQEFSRTHTKTDYKMRRDALRLRTDFDADEWISICGAANINTGASGGRSKYCAAWMWAQLTSGDWTLSPPFGGETSDSQRQVYMKLMYKILPKNLKSILIEKGNQLVEEYKKRSL
jgi:TniQ